LGDLVNRLAIKEVQAEKFKIKPSMSGRNNSEGTNPKRNIEACRGQIPAVGPDRYLRHASARATGLRNIMEMVGRGENDG